MNLPNKISMVRILMIPVFLVVLLVEIPGISFVVPVVEVALYRYIATVIFLAAAFTDFLDGYIARKRNQVTDLGKFLDPLSDKLLVMAAMLYLVGIYPSQLPSWIVVIILAREFIISGFRTIAARRGIVLAADVWGKVKTVFQIIMISAILVEVPGLDSILYERFSFGVPVFAAFTWFLIAATVGLTLISGVLCMVKNAEVLKEYKK